VMSWMALPYLYTIRSMQALRFKVNVLQVSASFYLQHLNFLPLPTRYPSLLTPTLRV
jgi:hypothetical protein